MMSENQPFASLENESPADAALRYIQEGFYPIPVPYRSKRPILKGWPGLRITPEDVHDYFNGRPQNIGMLLGEAGATDIDCDAPEAVSAAAFLLPETGFVYGRHSKPASHRMYFTDPPGRSEKFIDPTDKCTLLEFRCRKGDGTVGFQSIVPPSTHKDTGEATRF
jgi:hypothetical protein